MRAKKLEKSVLIFIILIAFIVRAWGINFGLPYSLHFDEGLLNYTAFFAASHKLRPDQFAYPMFYPYLIIFLYGFYYLLGLLMGLWHSTREFFIAYLTDATPFLLLTRFSTVLISTATVGLLYWIGKKLYHKKIGLVAAFLLSLTFLSVQEAHYTKEDTLVGFLGLSAFYLAVRILKNGKTKDYVLGGMILGILFATKYHFFIFLPLLIFAHFLRYSRSRSSLKVLFNRKFLIGAVLIPVVFFLLNPYIIINYRQAVANIVGQFEVTTVPWVSPQGQPIFLYYLTHHLKHGMGTPLLLVAWAGIVCLLLKSPKRENLLLVLTPLAFFITLMVFGSQNFARYAIPILPFLSLSAAVILNNFFKKQAPLIIISLLIILPSFLRILKFDYYLTQKDTRLEAKDWIEKNILPGTKVINEGAVRSQYASLYGPPIWMDTKSLGKLLKETQEKGLEGDYLALLIEARKGKVGYNLLGIPVLDQGFTSSYCYLISSSWAKKHQEGYREAFLRVREKDYALIKTFVPNPQLKADFI